MFGICLLYIKFKTAKFLPEGQQLPLQYLERDVWNVPAIYQFTTATFDPGGQQFFWRYLEWDVWDALSEQLQAPPGALVQEAQGYIKGGPAPYFQRCSLLHDM